MLNTVAIEPAALALVIESALRQLRLLGQLGLYALEEPIATRGECSEFDAGADLLDGWIGSTDID